MIKDLTAILLAAGDSTRLWPIEDKLFLNINGLPLIQYTLRNLTAIGINKVIIVANNKNIDNCQKLISFNKSLDIKVIIQENDLGMAGAILTADPILTSEKILIVGPSDIVEESLSRDFLKKYNEQSDGIFVGKYLQEYMPLGYYSVENNLITDIIEKPGHKNFKSQLASIVFDYFKDVKRLVLAINKSKNLNDDLYEQAKVQMIKDGAVFKLLAYNGYWGFLKYPYHILTVSSYFLSKIKKEFKNAKIDKTAKVIGNVLIEDGVTILENAKIVGPAIISKGVLIGQNSLVRESIIGQNTVIGFASEITRSYIGNNCWFHHNYIGDSVIHDNVAFGFGATVANYRLDSMNIETIIAKTKVNTSRTKLGAIIGKNVRIGVNSSIMPGIKIGKNSFVGSSVSLSQDLADNKYIEVKKESFRIHENRIKNVSTEIEKNKAKLKF